MKYKLLVASLLCALSFVFLGPAVGGQGLNAAGQMTYVTFSQPVEMPGGTTLAAGTYMFKVINSWAGDTEIVQVSNKEGTHVYGTVLTVPDYRLTPTGDTVLTFRERVASSPLALRAWFYPGNNYGHEFVYPKSEATELAAANHENVPSIPDTTASDVTNGSNPDDTLKNTHVTLATPDQQDVELPQQNQVQAVNPTPANTEAQNTSPTQPQGTLVAENSTLPKTASSIPSIALIGILLLASSILIGFLRRRHSFK